AERAIAGQPEPDMVDGFGRVIGAIAERTDDVNQRLSVAVKPATRNTADQLGTLARRHVEDADEEVAGRLDVAGADRDMIELHDRRLTRSNCVMPPNPFASLPGRRSARSRWR